MVRFSKYVIMLIVLAGVVVINYNKVCSQTLSLSIFIFNFLSSNFEKISYKDNV